MDEPALTPTSQAALASPLAVASALVRGARPRQWPKNLLVLAAPAAAGLLTEAEVLGRTGVAFLAFTLVASGTYLCNDVRDRAEDAQHPVKRLRPVASGQVAPATATVAGVALIAAGIGLPLWLGMPALTLVTGAYVVLTAAYSLGLQRVALLDLASVASGFVLRAVAGAAATGITLSKWFLIVTSFGSLYVVANKRFAELRDASVAAPGSTRRALVSYTPELLREIRFTASAVTIAAYVLWAFENADAAGGSLLFEVSILPFVLAVYRYALAVERGLGEAPEEVFVRDRPLQVYTVLWAATFAAAIHAG